ncbi:hypothetical protein [Streptomyces sp. NPDC058612]|uniref:hypothetical protein n=1 Tax=Streptomyces sp. NPDC058612 TaxID=3346555 RepID=UPI003660A9E4
MPQRPSAATRSPGHRLRLRLRLTVGSSDAPGGVPNALGMEHQPVGGVSVNTVHASSTLLLPLLGPG